MLFCDIRGLKVWLDYMTSQLTFHKITLETKAQAYYIHTTTHQHTKHTIPTEGDMKAVIFGLLQMTIYSSINNFAKSEYLFDLEPPNPENKTVIFYHVVTPTDSHVAHLSQKLRVVREKLEHRHNSKHADIPLCCISIGKDIQNMH